MAGDKLRDGFPVEVSFAAGEQPSDTKLNGWANQTQNALQALEQAVGDILDQTQALGSGNKLSNRDLQIGNIGRLLGPASMLNPQIIGDLNITDFTVSIPIGVKEFVLPHPPLVGGSHSSIDWNESARFTSEKLSADALAADGDFYVDYTTGRVYTYTRTQAGDQATYDYDSIGDSFSNATLNIIPDANQTSERCNVIATVGGFFVETPYIKYDQDGILATDGSDPNYSDGASTHNKQRAQLPSFLSVLSIDDLIPDGFIRLFDHAIGTVVDGAIFRYQNQSKVKVENVNLTVGSSQYSIITIGASLSEILYAVRQRQREHIHDGSDGGSRVAHADLTGNIYDGMSGVVTDTWGASGVPLIDPGYIPSKVEHNDHPQYLMRAGYKTSIDPANSDNAMRGEILMGSTSPSGNDYANLSADSRSLFFGNESGPRLRYKLTYDALQLASKSLMVDLDLTIGRSAALNANTNYLGFGSDPANNNMYLDEASSTYKFKNDGITTGTIMEAGHYVAGAISNPRYYFNAIGSGNYLQHTGGGYFDFFAAGVQTGTEVRAARLRTLSNQVVFGDTNDYITFTEGPNLFDFYADGSPNSSNVTGGSIYSRSGNFFFNINGDDYLEYDDSVNRFRFVSDGNIYASVLQAGMLRLVNGTDTLMTGAQLADLLDGGNTTAHKHDYTMVFSGETSVFRAANDYTIQSFEWNNGELLAVVIRGWNIEGEVGNNNQYFYLESSTSWKWYVEGPGDEDWDDDGTMYITIIYQKTQNTF